MDSEQRQRYQAAIVSTYCSETNFLDKFTMQDGSERSHSTDILASLHSGNGSTSLTIKNNLHSIFQQKWLLICQMHFGSAQYGAAFAMLVGVLPQTVTIVRRLGNDLDDECFDY